MTTPKYKIPQGYLFGYEPKYSLIGEISPSDFLSLASPITKEDTTTINQLKTKILQDKSVDIPYLILDSNGEVIGHEGRHRVLATQQLEMEKIPISIQFISENLYPSIQFPSYPDYNIVKILSKGENRTENLNKYQPTAKLPLYCKKINHNKIQCTLISQKDNTQKQKQQQKTINIQIADLNLIES